ncbi:MAG: PTS sugar transporter subunit IIA [Spirochaetaceae bacterium]|jgi:PTS system nitrogen regulatory IIA component|nr:PTS sugar transporter subunit IIA [Spirochaetaceae bacterium]
MELTQMIHRDCCRANILADGKDNALEVLADLALRHPAAQNADRDEILKGLHAREKQGSTGIGGQIAIPHTAVKGLEHFVVVMASSQKGVEFEAIDRKRVRLFFVILAPEGQASDHLKVLANISRTLSLSGVKQEMLAAPTETALFEAFVCHLASGQTVLQKKEEMSLLSLYLFDEDLIYDVLELFLQLGLDGANISESFGMGEYISNIPLFAGFLGFMNDRTNRSKQIQVLIPKSRIDVVVEGIESITGDLDKKQGAALMITPVLLWKGTMKLM